MAVGPLRKARPLLNGGSLERLVERTAFKLNENGTVTIVMITSGHPYLNEYKTRHGVHKQRIPEHPDSRTINEILRSAGFRRTGEIVDGIATHEKTLSAVDLGENGIKEIREMVATAVSEGKLGNPHVLPDNDRKITTALSGDTPDLKPFMNAVQNALASR